MPALCCYDTYISLKMTLKSTRGSNIVLFICFLGKALTLRDSLSTAEYGPCQDHFASGMRTFSQCDMGSQPRGSGLLPTAACQDSVPLRHTKGWATRGDSLAMPWGSQIGSLWQGTISPQGVDLGFILCKSMERLLITQAVLMVPPYASGHPSALGLSCSEAAPELTINGIPNSPNPRHELTHAHASNAHTAVAS